MMKKPDPAMFHVELEDCDGNVWDTDVLARDSPEAIRLATYLFRKNGGAMASSAIVYSYALRSDQ